MPVMDGYNSSIKIRELILQARLAQPIISAVTGHTEDAYIERSIQCGMN
jgi:CheY-like chemotaxis protein